MGSVFIFWVDRRGRQRILPVFYPRIFQAWKWLESIALPWTSSSTPKTLHPVLSRLAHARPQVVFVGLGAPKQEYFIDQHVRPLRIPVAVGVGGTFEIIFRSRSASPRNGLAASEWSGSTASCANPGDFGVGT